MTKIFLAFIVLLISCNERVSKPKLKDILNSGCYRDILDKQVVHFINSCYLFEKQGKCLFFYYNFYDQVRTDSVYRYDDDDVIVPDTWSVEGDSILTVRGISYSIIRYTNDSVYAKHHRQTDTLILTRNCNTFLGKRKTRITKVKFY